MAATHYTSAFYERLRQGATRSAEIIAPLVLKLVPAKNVLDVGCGDGSWLAAFQGLGASDVLGIDGEYVQRDLLQIPPASFQPADLAKPFRLDRVFDLALSLEVAEHLPPASAPGFIESLTLAGPAILFSAAIPHQGGDNHINEQWPEAWAAMFKKHGYLAIDAIRRHIWHNQAVEWWYAQNIMLYVRA